MKSNSLKFFFILSAYFFAPALYGQTEKGKSITGVSLSLIQSTDKSTGLNTRFDANRLQLGLDLNYGYFIKDNTLLSLSAGVSSFNTKAESNTGGPYKDYNTSFSFAPGIRQYFAESKGFHFFAGASYGLQFQKTGNNFENSTKSRYAWSSLEAELGTNYFVSRSVALEARVYHRTGLLDITNNTNSGLVVGLKYWPGNENYKDESSEVSTGKWISGLDISTEMNASRFRDNPETIRRTHRSEIYLGRFFGQNRRQVLGLGLGFIRDKRGEESDFAALITPYYEYYMRTSRLSPMVRLSSTVRLADNKESPLDLSARAGFGFACFVSDHLLIRAQFAELGLSVIRYKDGQNTYNQTTTALRIFETGVLGLAWRW